jgi:hypothetical protein
VCRAAVNVSHAAAHRAGGLHTVGQRVKPGENSLRPLYCDGLWLAEIWMPPAARSSRTTMPTVGVAAMPQSITSRPLATKKSRRAAANSGPCVRPSRPITIGPGGRVAANAAA